MNIGLAGLGYVGAATLRILQEKADLLRERSGEPLKIVAVSARDKSKNRACDLRDIAWVNDPRDLAARDDVDVIVEVIGGADGIAPDIAKAALGHGKHLVTANKAMMAKHGVALARSAEAAGLQLSFEAAVCGGVPVLKMLREGLAANKFSSVRGILNGTCNYILTRMSDEGMNFAAALGEAQQKGYAEADPAADIEGTDTANKLALLSALAFGTAPDLATVAVEGIRHITPKDLQDAATHGGNIKLIGSAERTGSLVIQRVQPIFVPLAEPLAQVSGADNAIEIQGDCAGTIFLQGQGAGGEATASAIIADLVDIARGNRNYAFGVISSQL